MSFSDNFSQELTSSVRIQKPKICEEEESSSESSVSLSSKECEQKSEEEIEIIKLKNKNLAKQVIYRFMSFKQMSRTLIEDKTEYDLTPLNKESLLVEHHNTKENRSQTLLHSYLQLKELKSQLLTAQKNLEHNLEEIKKIDVEKNYLKQDLQELQEIYIMGSTPNKSCCEII